MLKRKRVLVAVVFSRGRSAITVSSSSLCSASHGKGTPPDLYRLERDSPRMDRLAYEMRHPSIASGLWPLDFMAAIARLKNASPRMARSSNQAPPPSAVAVDRLLAAPWCLRWRPVSMPFQSTGWLASTRRSLAPTLPVLSFIGHPKREDDGSMELARRAMASTQRWGKPSVSATGIRSLHDLTKSLRLQKREMRMSLQNFSAISRPLHSPAFATVTPTDISASQPAEVHNLVQGEWKASSSWNWIVDPLNGEHFIKVADVQETAIKPFVESLHKCPKYGLHNPFRSPERYILYGDITTKTAHMLAQPEVSDFFARLIQRVSPKSYMQAQGEVYVTQKFLENFSGDQVRFLARSFSVPGNHLGQQSHGFRWPYGPVAIITPFNFPLEIPVLQLMGALYMGNKPILKVDSKVSIVMEQMLRLLHSCGLPKDDVDFINSDGKAMNKLLLEAKPSMTLFTGSCRVAEKLATDLKGRIKLEDAGFDWKILGPDVQEVDYIAWVCDQDAYACSGQKCSAQSILFVHENWSSSGLLSKMKFLAERRKLEDLTIGPVLTVTTESMLEHIDKLLQIPGSKLLFGGGPLENHSIPNIFGALKPTAIFVLLSEVMKENNFQLVTKEIFGPFQIVTEYKHDQLSLVLDACERMHAHLTAAVVSNDLLFLQDVIGKTVNGTTYAGMRARTTGAPQNHWFGPAGDPRGAGIGTPEAIKLVWSCHREIIYDVGPLPRSWDIPPPT